MLSFTKKNLFVAGGYALVLGLGIFLGQNFAEERDNLSSPAVLPLGLTDRTTKWQKMMQLLQQRYVDHVMVDTLQDFALVEVLNHLDPHSVYLSARKSEEQNRKLSGRFGGVGMEVFILKDTLLVTNLIPGGPAYASGIKRGDQILWINDVPVAGVGITQSKVSELVRGKQNTKVEFWVKRAGMELVEPIVVERDLIQESSIELAYLIDEQTAYIKIKQFGANTGKEFSEALERLLISNPKRLLVDLRHNGGGYFLEAMSVLEQMLPQGQLMVYTKGVHDERVDYYSAGGGMYEEGLLAILIDENSASASEIVAGAIQDLNRGLVVGRRSFGKGLVQQKFDFGDGSAVNLSVARYYTPSGRSIQKPYKDGHIPYFNELNQRFLSGELTSGKAEGVDTIASDGRIYRSGSGKAMISEGGIMPDIHVGLDTSKVNDFYLNLTDKQFISEFVYDHLIDQVPSYSSSHFIKEYAVPASVYSLFLREAKRKGFAFTWKESQESRKLIESDIKALLGRFFFGNETWLKLKNLNDAVIGASIRAMPVEEELQPE